MRNYILNVILCLVICLSGIGQEKKALEGKKSTTEEKKGPMSFGKFFKEGMKQVDAIFPCTSWMINITWRFLKSTLDGSVYFRANGEGDWSACFWFGICWSGKFQKRASG